MFIVFGRLERLPISERRRTRFENTHTSNCKLSQETESVRFISPTDSCPDEYCFAVKMSMASLLSKNMQHITFRGCKIPSDVFVLLVLVLEYAFSALTLLVRRQEGHPARKNWVMGCWRGYLGWGADLHIAQQMPLPLTISCSSKSRFVLPSWFYLSGTCSPEWSRTNSRRAVKRLCVCACSSWNYVSADFCVICVFTRDSIYAIARICHGNSVCLSVCPSVTQVDQSKTVEARITQFSPYSSPIPLVCAG